MVKGEIPTVALFGGSFDPPHLGHKQIIDTALQVLQIDAVVVVPAWRNPFKEATLAPPKQRLKWVQKVFGSCDRIIIEPYEIEQKRAVTTIETLEALQDRYRIAYLIIGADNVAGVERWHRFRQIDERVIWAVATRPGYQLPKNVALSKYVILPLQSDLSSTKIRQGNNIDAVATSIRNEVETLLKKEIT